MAKMLGRRMFSGQRDDDDPRSRGAMRAEEKRQVRADSLLAVLDRMDLRPNVRRAVDSQLCQCRCHYEPDHCAICTNDYADLCT